MEKIVKDFSEIIRAKDKWINNLLDYHHDSKTVLELMIQDLENNGFAVIPMNGIIHNEIKGILKKYNQVNE